MDSTFQAIKAAIDKQATAFEEFKTVNDQRLEAARKGDEAKDKELEAKLSRIETDVKTFTDLKKQLEVEQQLQRDRIEELESRGKTPGKTAAEKRSSEYKDAFLAAIRNKFESPAQTQQLTDMMKKMIEAKDITIGTGSAGGFAVPEEISREIERLELKFSPVRRLVKVVQVGTSDYKELMNIRGTTSGWVGETSTRTPSNTPSLREITPTHGELYAYPQCSEWSLDDIFFNVESWLTQNVADEFALQEGDAVIRGNGTNKPTGMLNTTPVTTDDFASPLRAAAAYQYIDSTASPFSINGSDALIRLIYKVNSAYRSMGTFVMNSNTTAEARRLKDTTNQYLWAPGLAAGQPDRLLGYPVETWEQMDDIASAKFPVAFGDFRRAYVLTDRVGLRITRDNVTNVGFVRFYVRRREGGIVLNNDAIKFIRTA